MRLHSIDFRQENALPQIVLLQRMTMPQFRLMSVMWIKTVSTPENLPRLFSLVSCAEREIRMTQSINYARRRVFLSMSFNYEFELSLRTALR